MLSVLGKFIYIKQYKLIPKGTSRHGLGFESPPLSLFGKMSGCLMYVMTTSFSIHHPQSVITQE